jgi:hypothetical protein
MNEAVEEAPPSSEGSLHPFAPVLRAAWLLRSTALASVIATALAVVAVPGLRGNARDAVVLGFTRMSWAFAYFMCGLLVTALVVACYELSRVSRLSVTPRAIAIGAAGAVLAFAAPALLVRLPSWGMMALSTAAIVTAIAGGWAGLRADHTRAVGVIVLALAFAAALRVVAWELATIAGARPSPSLYGWSRGVATAGVVFEGIGQMIAATWLGTRARVLGLGLSWVAIGAAFVATWGAAHGGTMTAPFWQAALHTALAGAVGVPAPFALGAVATFLASCSILLAFAAALQQRQVAAVVMALTLSLLARGSFDAPLRALAAATAGLWVMVAITDERAMWRALLAQREHAEQALRAP